MKILLRIMVVILTMIGMCKILPPNRNVYVCSIVMKHIFVVDSQVNPIKDFAHSQDPNI